MIPGIVLVLGEDSDVFQWTQPDTLLDRVRRPSHLYRIYLGKSRGAGLTKERNLLRVVDPE